MWRCRRRSYWRKATNCASSFSPLRHGVPMRCNHLSSTECGSSSAIHSLHARQTPHRRHAPRQPRRFSSAGVLALVASGIAPLPFTFLGFAPPRTGERTDFYRDVSKLGHTAIVYESPERVIGSLEDALNVLGDVEITVAREMTKLHEEIL